MSSAVTVAPLPDTTTRKKPVEPTLPVGGECSAGGDHARIPVQGKNYSVCAKCGETC